MKNKKTLVYINTPRSITSKNTIEKILRLKTSLSGSFDNVVILGWNFVLDITNIIKNYTKAKNLQVSHETFLFILNNIYYKQYYNKCSTWNNFIITIFCNNLSNIKTFYIKKS